MEMLYVKALFILMFGIVGCCQNNITLKLIPKLYRKIPCIHNTYSSFVKVEIVLKFCIEHDDITGPSFKSIGQLEINYQQTSRVEDEFRKNIL